MMDNTLRRVKDVVYAPVARRIGSTLKPTTITLIAGGVGLLAAVAAWQGMYGVGLILWWLNRALDGLDGAVARASGQQSDLGGYIDTLVDFAMYSVIPVGLALHAPTVELLLALAFMLATFYINAAAFLYLSAILERRRLGAKQRGELTTIHMPKGLIEGVETVIFYSLFFVLPQFLGTLFVILGVLVIFTTLQHVVWASRNLR
ncbi:MAG TPA: CDP-alcohol phosphatidyltransferase family protein [Aggregatilineales bacterium]|jgi:phosphatidylglycerophosphate synthase|nr:CDP-alcohol phosphatidyltransferase family protein [Aggregatilineales bacterium]